MTLSILLERAGEDPGSVDRFKRTQYVFAGCGFFLGLIGIAIHMPLFLPIVFAGLGAILPRAHLHSNIRKRQRLIALNLPSYLDLLTLSLEAGLDLIASLEEIITRDSLNPLRDECSMTLKSIRMGQSRSMAFIEMGKRTGVESLMLLAASVTQSEELGSSLGQIFRLQAEQLRRELSRIAEEQAQRAPLKMLLPLLFLIFPVVFILLLAPLGLKLAASF